LEIDIVIQTMTLEINMLNIRVSGNKCLCIIVQKSNAKMAKMLCFTVDLPRVSTALSARFNSLRFTSEFNPYKIRCKTEA